MAELSLALLATLKAFGKAASYAPPSGQPFGLVHGAVHKANHELAAVSKDGVAFSTIAPTALVLLADFPEDAPPVRGGVITVAGKNWQVNQKPLLDGQGGALLKLHEVKS